VREPDLVSRMYKGVKAWRITKRSHLDHQATLESWLVQGNFHPAWTFWQVSAITLADIPGVPPAKKRYDGAEYEFLIASLESPPGSPEVHPDPDDIETLRPLLPLDVVVQFHGVADGHAAGIVKAAVTVIVMDGVSPDSDNRTWWVQMVNQTADHIRAGKHN
jgi:hypothetical protein